MLSLAAASGSWLKMKPMGAPNALILVAQPTIWLYSADPGCAFAMSRQRTTWPFTRLDFTERKTVCPVSRSQVV